MNSFGINTCQKLIPWMLASSMHPGIVMSQRFKRVSWAMERFYVLDFLVCVWYPRAQSLPHLAQQLHRISVSIAALSDRSAAQFLRLHGGVWPYFPVSVLGIPRSLNTAILFITANEILLIPTLWPLTLNYRLFWKACMCSYFIDQDDTYCCSVRGGLRKKSHHLSWEEAREGHFYDLHGFQAHQYPTARDGVRPG